MKALRVLLIIFGLLTGLSAVGGGIALITNRAGIPVSDLAGSMFSSYLWPGIILAVVVGGTHLAAAIMLWRKSKYSIESLTVAGFGMLIWMFTEVCVVGYHSWLQPLYFGLDIAALIAVMILLRYERSGILKA